MIKIIEFISPNGDKYFWIEEKEGLFHLTEDNTL